MGRGCMAAVGEYASAVPGATDQPHAERIEPVDARVLRAAQQGPGASSDALDMFTRHPCCQQHELFAGIPLRRCLRSAVSVLLYTP